MRKRADVLLSALIPKSEVSIPKVTLRYRGCTSFFIGDKPGAVVLDFFCSFIEPNSLNSATKKKQLVALINGLPQSLVCEPCPFIVSKEHTSTILFDTHRDDDWLEALDGQEHVTDFYIVTSDKRRFDMLRKLVVEQRSSTSE
ncbi:MAG: hypothetical protein IPF79_04900 [Ignavibacteria bacterium]|nr:hypothetical protein [Ignavibacteria bacterium]